MKFKIEFEQKDDKTTIEGNAETWMDIADRFHDALLGASFVVTRGQLSEFYQEDDYINGIDYDNIWVDEGGGYADADVNVDVGNITVSSDHDVA